MLRLSLSLAASLLAFAWLGCTPAPSTTSSAASLAVGAPSDAVQPHSMRQAPFVVQVQGPDDPKPGEVIRVVVTIERQFIDSTPFHVQVALPVGADLVRGDLEEVIVDPERAVIERAIEVRLGRIPEGDLVVTVQQRGEGWGGHAERPYRFGRPEPTRPPLKRGAPVNLPGQLGGRPVVLD